MIANKPVPAERIEAITRELLERKDREQAIRNTLHQLLQTGIAPAELKVHPVVKEMQSIDQANEAYLMAILAECGWPDAARFGARAAHAAFLIVQHSGSQQLMIDALPFIEADVRAKHINGDQYALLYDRLSVSLHGKQRYGSQLITATNGELMLEPLEDPGRVDEHRKELGMAPLADYLARFAKQNGNRPIKMK